MASQATENYASQFYELHNKAYSQFDDQFVHLSSNYYPPQYKFVPLPPRNSDFKEKVLAALNRLQASNQLLAKFIDMSGIVIDKQGGRIEG